MECDGIRAMVKKDFYGTVRDFGADILCMQETKAQEDTMPALQTEMNGYDFVFNSAVQKRLFRDGCSFRD